MILHRVGISIQGRNLEKKLLNLRLFLLLRLFFDFDKMESSSSQLDIFFLTEKPLFDEETCSSEYSFWNLDQTQTYTCNGQTDASVTVPEPGKLKNIFLEVLL